MSLRTVGDVPLIGLELIKSSPKTSKGAITSLAGRVPPVVYSAFQAIQKDFVKTHLNSEEESERFVPASARNAPIRLQPESFRIALQMADQLNRLHAIGTGANRENRGWGKRGTAFCKAACRSLSSDSTAVAAMTASVLVRLRLLRLLRLVSEWLRPGVLTGSQPDRFHKRHLVWPMPTGNRWFAGHSPGWMMQPA